MDSSSAAARMDSSSATAYVDRRLAAIVHADGARVLDDDLPEDERPAAARVSMAACMTFATYVIANWACVAEVGDDAQRAHIALCVFLPMLDRYTAEVDYNGRGWTRSGVTMREAGYKCDFRSAVVEYAGDGTRQWAEPLMTRFTCI